MIQRTANKLRTVWGHSLCLVLAIQIATFCLFCFLLSFDGPLTYIADGDAYRNIGVALRSSLLADNGFYNYGPVYYRLAHFLSHLVSNDFYYTPDTLSHLQSTAAASLRLVSVILLYISLFSLACFVVRGRALAAGLVLVLVSLLLIDGTWQKYVFRIYPDLTLSCFLLLSFIFAFKSVAAEKKNTLIIFSIIFWALALQTKLSALFYLPALVVLLFSKKIFSLHNIIFPIFGVLIALAFGYPQNKSSYRIWHKAATQGATFSESITPEWIKYVLLNYWNQVWIVAIVMVIISLLNYRFLKLRIIESSWIRYLSGSLLALSVPLLAFISAPLSSGTSHYAMSVVMVTLVMIPVLVTLAINFVSHYWPSILHLLNNRRCYSISLLILTAAFLGKGIETFIPKQLFKTFNITNSCFKEFKEFQPLFLSHKGFILATPNSPYFDPTSLPDGLKVRQQWWTMRREELSPEVSGILVSRQFMQRFKSKSPRIKQYNFKTYRQNAEMVAQITEFAHLLQSEQAFVDTHGFKWKQVSVLPSCRFDYWIKEE